MMKALALLGMALLVACDDRAPSPSGAPASSQAAPPASAAVTAAKPAPSLPTPAGSALSAAEAAQALPGDQPLLVLVDDPGEAPRQVLSHQPAVGERATLSIEAHVMSMAGGDVSQHAFVFAVDARVIEPRGQDIAVSLSVTKAEPKPPGSAADDVLPRLVGTSTIWRMDRRGGLRDAPLPAIDPEARQLWVTVADALRDAIPPLPDSAVGKGARWTATDRIWRGGVMLLRESQILLEDSGGDTLRIKAQVIERPVRDGARDPATPSELAITAHAGMGAGARRLAWQPGKLLPLAADSQIAADLRIEVRPLGDTSKDAAPRSEDVRITQVLTLLREP